MTSHIWDLSTKSKKMLLVHLYLLLELVMDETFMISIMS